MTAPAPLPIRCCVPGCRRRWCACAPGSELADQGDLFDVREPEVPLVAWCWSHWPLRAEAVA